MGSTAAAAATDARLRTAGDCAGAGVFSTNFCFTSFVVNGAPVLRLVDDDAELSDVLESLLADRVDFTCVAGPALVDVLGCRRS